MYAINATNSLPQNLQLQLKPHPHPHPQPQELSIIVVIKNRTVPTLVHNNITYKLPLFATNLDCLFRLIQPHEKWELIIVDFDSDDIDMQEYLTYMFNSYNKPNFKCELITLKDEFFNKGKGLNIGAENASYDLLMFLDADMKITDRKMFETAYEQCLTKDKVYFPVCMNYENPEHSRFTPRPTGKGNVFITKKYLQLKKWPQYEKWGLEDDHFFDFFNAKGLVYRDCPGTFFHQWHPTDHQFKNKYYKGV